MSSTTHGLTVSVENNIQIIRFNNPKKKNAIQTLAYELISNSLRQAAENPDIFLTVFTGTGEYYSSGFDITDPTNISEPDKSSNLLYNMIETIIDHPKLIVAIVNGPAIGLAVTTLGLCDIVYCSEKATFTTPFSKLGLCAEGCASFTFPQILGKSKANEILLVSHEMSADEALKFGFVSQVFKHSELPTVWTKINQFKNVSLQSIIVTKKLSRRFDKEILKRTNAEEIKQVKECFESEDFGNAIVKFLSRKSKL